MLERVEHIATSGWTPGAIGIWLGLFSLAGIWWKGIPAIVVALEGRKSGTESRIAALLEAQTARFDNQLKQADDRHEECMEGQRRLRIEIDEMRRENDKLYGIIRSMQQGALSVQSVVARTIKESRGEDRE